MTATLASNYGHDDGTKSLKLSGMLHFSRTELIGVQCKSERGVPTDENAVIANILAITVQPDTDNLVIINCSSATVSELRKDFIQ